MPEPTTAAGTTTPSPVPAQIAGGASARPARRTPAQRDRRRAAARTATPAAPSDWSVDELAEQRAELLAQADSLEAELVEARSAAEAVQHSTSGQGSGDEADAGTKTFEREHEQSLANNSRTLLLQVQRALERLDAGTYGGCERCGEQIPKPRLQAFPRVTLCVACKQREERR